MLKLVFLIVAIIIAFIAYTGTDVSEEYDAISDVRDQALDKIFDPLAKKALKQATDSNLDQVIDEKVNQYMIGE